MTTTASAFVFAAIAVTVGYLVLEHRRLNAPDVKPAPDMLDELVSASATPGNAVGPGATSNSGHYMVPPPRMINLGA